MKPLTTDPFRREPALVGHLFIQQTRLDVRLWSNPIMASTDSCLDLTTISTEKRRAVCLSLISWLRCFPPTHFQINRKITVEKRRTLISPELSFKSEEFSLSHTGGFWSPYKELGQTPNDLIFDVCYSREGESSTCRSTQYRLNHVRNP